MPVMQRVAGKRKSISDTNSTVVEPLLYLLTSGPARNIWTMHTLVREGFIELMPVFDAEASAQALLMQLQQPAHQATTISFSRLQSMVQHRDIRFLFNPQLEFQGDMPLWKEGPNWLLTLDQIATLVGAESAGSALIE